MDVEQITLARSKGNFPPGIRPGPEMAPGVLPEKSLRLHLYPGEEGRAGFQGAAGEKAAPLQYLRQGVVPQGQTQTQVFAHPEGAPGHHWPQ